MLLLALNGLGFAGWAKKSDLPLIDWLGYQVSHPSWISNFHGVGFALWDMIQPAFMFIVGVAVPYSFAKRQKLGDGRTQILNHGLWRALLLVLLGVFLQSMRSEQTNWLFTNVLSQIGLGYGLLLLMAGRSYKSQFAVALIVLAISWSIYAFYPVEQPVDTLASNEPGRASGFFAHWSLSNNAGIAFDQWFLNLFPRTKPFVTHPGGYCTINFIPASVTMLMGLMCGQLLRDHEKTPYRKIQILLVSSLLCLVSGLVIGETLCPIVKRLWTPSWVLFSGAYVIGMLALFYWIIDVQSWKRWTFPFVIVGMNPLAMYMMGMTLRRWVVGQLHIHLPEVLFMRPWGYVVDAVLPAMIFWLVCLWMYRRKLFLRL